MESEILVRVEGVSKKFCRDLKRSLAYGVQDLTAEIFGINRNQEALRKEEFWAVKDISFELKRGECLGLIGHNGAGKSTLLKMLNGLIKPDQGKITMKGRVGALIELGAGFNPILTGRENVYINGQILGFSKKEIDEKFNSIIDFAEIGEFIDTPVQNYSSGMKVRLGFAVAAQMEPDVLIIDEVLAVGDSGFKIKSFNRISELVNSSSVIFVSHSMPQVALICNSCILLDQGKVAMGGNMIGDIIDAYFKHFGELTGNGNIEFSEHCDLVNIEVSYTNEIKNNDPFIFQNHNSVLTIEVQLILDKRFREFSMRVQITDRDLRIVALSDTDMSNKPIVNDGEVTLIRMKIPNIFLSSGDYSVTIFITNSEFGLQKYLGVMRNIKKFSVKNHIGKNSGHVTAPFYLPNILN
ncbi:MAG: polysaccharide ABC transporter ATP-binding protein [Cyclobacteriaceae bacterium]